MSEADLHDAHDDPRDLPAGVAPDVAAAEVEADPADAAEQRVPVAGPAADGTDGGGAPDDANEADVAEQRRVVETDEDDYR